MRENKLIDVYPYTFSDSKELFYLLFKRSDNVIYSGQWRMIGGKVAETETYWQAAAREFIEETGLIPQNFWTVPTLNSFYLPNQDEIVHAVPFAVEISNGQHIVLNHEHSDYAFFSIDEAISNLVWPEQKRIIRLVHDIVLANGVLDEWIISH